MPTRRVAIIGAGMGGLAAGVYGRLAGLDTTIFEMHDKPGGMCTAWTRQGYTFDGCIHHLAGCLPGTPTYRMSPRHLGVRSLLSVWPVVGRSRGTVLQPSGAVLLTRGE